MKLDIPKTIELECPNCRHIGHHVDESEILTCGGCGLKLHKIEFIEQNKAKVKSKIDTKKITEDLIKELKKGLKKFK